MSYYSKIEQSKSKVYNHAIATKILDLMDKLRMDDNVNYSRRWVWELIQNAKDVAYEDIGVSVQINLLEHSNKGFLEFQHNGKPFSTDNVTFLIEQVSTKDRKAQDNETKTTGKFGTGFLSTHLLSEVVEVNGVLKEHDEPYRQFNLLLDRRGNDIDEIIDSVNNSLASLESIDSSPSYDEYCSDEFNSMFRYELDHNGLEAATIGLSDLHISIAYALVFVAELKSIKIINEKIEYKISNKESLDEYITIYTVTKTTPSNKEDIKIALLSKNDTSIAVEIQYLTNNIFLKESQSTIPKIFCDFPLIGTEDFPFPVIINSPMFNPNEPRNGIYLTNKQGTKIEQNKALLLDAVDLYYHLLEYASKNGWGNMYLLARILPIREKEWISKDWLEKEVVKPIKEKLLVTPIVDTEKHGRKAIKNKDGKTMIWFPSSSKENIRKNIWDLISKWIPSMLPRKTEIDVWYETIWSGFPQLTIKVITNTIANVANIKNLSDQLDTSVNTIDWLNSYYKLVESDETIINDVINDKFVVIPNQNGVFKKKSELNIDRGIEEELKNVLLILEQDIREQLLHKGIQTGQNIRYPVKNQEDVVNQINKILDENKNEHIGKACDYLITLFCDDNEFPIEREIIFELCNAVYPEDVNIKREINSWSDKIWLEADKKQVKWIAQFISESININALTEKLGFNDSNQTLFWLNGFISFLIKYGYDNLLNIKKEPLLPNQNGEFRIKDDLFLDDGEIDEILKDISAELGYDFRDELLDVNIFLDLPKNKTKNQSHVAEEIIKLISPKLSEIIRTDETKQIFRKLYLWFNKNKETAQDIFGDLYLNKHRLYDDDEIAENIQLAEKLSELMEEFNIGDLSTLRHVLQANVNSREQITQDTLASLGVTSIEEFEDALKDKDIAAQFTHSSNPTIEMFLYAQSLIDRAKKNVIEYLSNLPDYDCSEWEELATTVIGGIKKDGLLIHVVIRPSDNGEVIVYYSSEKDSLDYVNAELWIDNGIDTPQHLTLGKILKTTGINRIPV